MTLRISVLIALLVLAIWPAKAENLELPGLQRDAQAYVRSLTLRAPAGGTPAARKSADQQAAAATAKKDWPAVVAALEERIAQGEAGAKHFLDLAAAQLRRSPPEPRNALLAAWQGFTASQSGEAEIPGLRLMAEALTALDRDAQAVRVWQEVVERAPGNGAWQQALKDLQRSVGVTVRRVRTEADTEPPRACVEFAVPPVRRTDFAPGDWVRLAPPVSNAAVTREGDEICVSGLPHGATTRITLRAGMPGEGGLTLIKETTLPVVIPNLFHA